MYLREKSRARQDVILAYRHTADAKSRLGRRHAPTSHYSAIAAKALSMEKILASPDASSTAKALVVA